MEGERVLAGLSCLAFVVLLASCGGGDAAVGPRDLAPMELGADREPLELVVRLDLDEDGQRDVLVLRDDGRGLRVVEALRGLHGGGFADATSEWAGRGLSEDVERALRVYATRSMAVAAETDLRVAGDRDELLVSVIE